MAEVINVIAHVSNYVMIIIMLCDLFLWCIYQKVSLILPLVHDCFFFCMCMCRRELVQAYVLAAAHALCLNCVLFVCMHEHNDNLDVW